MHRLVDLVRFAGLAGLLVFLGSAGCSVPRPYTGGNASQSGGMGGVLGAEGGKGPGGTGGGGAGASVASGGVPALSGTGGAVGGGHGGAVGAAGGGPLMGIGGASAGGTGGLSKGSGGLGTGGIGSGGAGMGGVGGAVAEPCSPGFMNCDAKPDCETDISSAIHCGGCATTCSGNTPICAVSGSGYACSNGCTGSQVRCGGVCTDLNSDASNCAACGKTCTISNGTPQCAGGVCVPVSCNTGYTKCGSACQYTDGDVNNCGGCNLKCPAGSLCKSGSCEVRVGYPNRFLDNQDYPFSQSAGTLVAFPIAVDRAVTLLAFGYINESTAVGAVASFGLYNADTSAYPTTLVASSADVVLKGSVQEVATQNIVLQAGRYYFSILIRDEAEPKIYSSGASQIDCWIGPQSYANGLPITFASTAPEAFPTATPNIYLVVKEAGE